MNILITGGTGFIGRHLANILPKWGHSVRCLVRKRSNINLLKNTKVDIYYGDLLVKESLGRAFEKIDLVYHLAGEVYSRKKSDYYKGNVLATNNLLEICEAKGIQRMVYMSSVGVYKPVTTKTLLTEESECEPITFYGKTKLLAEELIKKSNLPSVIIRAPVVYGPTQPPVLNKFFSDALNKKKVYVIGDGDNLRSLCFVDNLVEGLKLLANKLHLGGKTYILSDNSPYTFNDIIATTSKVIHGEIRIVRLPSILGDISWKIYNLMGNLFDLYFVELYAMRTMQLNLGCDITKAREEIGYNPKVTLEAGIKSTIDWIKNNYIKG
jgi:nucleoside-diphosphate-sugar epimerase